MPCQETPPNSTWPAKQEAIDKRLATNPQEPVPQFFIDDESGEGLQLIGSAENLGLTIENLTAYLWVAIETLLEDEDGDQVTLMIRRTDMTAEEVDALPEL